MPSTPTKIEPLRLGGLADVPLSRRLLFAVVLVAVALASPGLLGIAGAQDSEGDGSTDTAGEAIRGQLVNRDDDDAPVAGVEIVVSTAAGEEVGTVTSAEDGSYFLELPGEGQYVAQLQVDSLPEGVTLTDPDRTAVEFSVNPNQQKPLLFPFGKSTRVTSSTWEKVVSAIIQGVWLGLILAMTAIGLSLTYGTTKITNFAHGEMVTFGALVAWYFNQIVGLPLLLAGPIAVVVCGAAGAALDSGIFGRLTRRGTSLFSLLVVSLGLSILLQNLFQYLFGTRTRPYAEYAVQPGGLSIGRTNIPPKIFATIIISVVVLGAAGLFLSRARFGKAMRAVADNGPLASASGINTERVVMYVWIGGSALAGLGGILYSVSQQVSFQQGQTLLLLMFAGITLGGLGTAYGAAVGCFVLGLFIQLSTLVIPTSVKNVGALLVLILVLLFKPEGLFGRRERVG